MLTPARNSETPGAEPTMAEAAHDTDLCLRIMDRHAVRAGALARESGVAESQLSRYLSGQFMLPLRVFAALWRITRDPELLALLASAEAVVVPVRLRDIHRGGPRGAEGAEKGQGTGSEPGGDHPLTPSLNRPIRRQARPDFFAAHPSGVVA